MGEGAALAAARASGLVRRDEPVLVLVSGGADSTCLLDVSVQLGARVAALHVNHGLRGEESDADELACRELCERLGVPLVVESARPQGRNLQASARELRYSLAERHAEVDYATAHTLSDQAETVVYRLAVSPGRRALLGMEPRRGRLVRPLLEVTRGETRAWCSERGLVWREDASNADPRFARARVRVDVMPALRELSPAAERTIAETARLLRDESAVVDEAVRGLLARTGRGPVSLAELRSAPRALARLALRELAEQAVDAPRALSRRDADRILELEEAGTRTLDLGGGLTAVAEYGTLRFATADPPEAPDPVLLPVPGSVRFGPWEVEARLGSAGEAAVAAAALGSAVTVRAWREGDRMRPAGLGGTKSLQDLFTDRKVPRELRRTLPVVEAGGEIAWVAGVAVGERFRPDDGEVVGLSARRPAVA